MNRWALLAAASASVAMSPGLAAHGVSTTSSRIVPPAYLGGVYGNLKTGSRSRPDHFVGEIAPNRRTVTFSAGSFAMGDFASIGVRSDRRFADDLLVGAALLLQAVQSPLDREIQEVTSLRFESYWD